MKLTIVICTHNRVELLEKTITSLNEAMNPSALNVQILVIANACSDTTIHFLKSYTGLSGKQLPLEFEEEPIAGKSHALNRAISMVNQGFLCFVDDDHKVDNNFLCAISEAIVSHPQIKMFCGQIIPDWTGEEPEWIHETGKYKIYPLPVPHFEMGTEPVLIEKDGKLPGGGNLIIHRDVFTKIGNFNVELGPKGRSLAGSEDSNLVLRALAAGETIQYLPSIIQYHYVDSERLQLSYLIRKSYERTRTFTMEKQPQAHSIPRYLWRKLIEYIFYSCFSFNLQKSRFYLMRIASTLGEISALRTNNF